ncbi:mucin-binding protein, partial [Lactobacillus gallinarum]|uniref:mucin-binding protein n=1 Tax=Lactobacillus gallinarum TaxID=52242 RepID=UPI001DC9CB45|nr:YSIRK signal domain/LPXTG anchor domain surface protein [Lactobacillus gallinarum]
NPNNKKDIPGLTHDDLEKKVTRDFTYNFTDGSNHPEAKEDSQTVTFEGHATIDKVTGQLVTVDEQGNITGVGQVQWDKDSKELPNVVAKTVDGYHVVSASNANADGSVDALEVNPNSGSIHVVINYAPNNETVFGKQIVHYVDGDNHNHELMDDSTNSTCVFTKDDKTGKWKEDSYTFSDATAPVIYGYVAEQKTYKGQVATPTDPNKEITIVYHKVGKIVPVGKDGKEIPGAPTPEYKNDPTDPTNVKPNEPIPNVPGYTPVDPSPITPQDPTKPT